MTEQEIRAERQALLTGSDWTQTTDAPLTQNERARWREYRQNLRDVPEQDGFPESVVWPDVPEKDPVLPPGELHI